MGQCYSVYLDISIKNEEGLLKALEAKLEEDCGKEENGFDIDDFRNSADLHTIDGIISMYLVGHHRKIDTKTNGKKRTYHNDFYSSYSWCGVMCELFKTMIPFVYATGTKMFILPDYGMTTLRIRKGELYQTYK